MFHRTWFSKALLGVFSIGPLWIAWISHQQGETGPSLFFIIFSGFMFLLITQDPVRVSITREAVVIFYPGWKRVVRFDQITGITLKDMPSRGNVWAVVVIERRQQRPIMLSRFREGSLALRDALQSAWGATQRVH